MHLGSIWALQVTSDHHSYFLPKCPLCSSQVLSLSLTPLQAQRTPWTPGL